MSIKKIRNAAKKAAKPKKISFTIDPKIVIILLLLAVILVIMPPPQKTTGSTPSDSAGSGGGDGIPSSGQTQPTTSQTSSFKFNGLSWRGTCGITETTDVSMLYESAFDGVLNWNGKDFAITKGAKERPLVSNPEEGTYRFYVTNDKGEKMYESVISLSKTNVQVSGNPVMTSPVTYEYESGLKDYGADIRITVDNKGSMPTCIYVGGTIGTKNIGNKCSYFSKPGTKEDYTCRADAVLEQGSYNYRIFVSGLDSAYVKTGSFSVPV